MTKFFKELIPKYAIAPLLCIIAANTIAYFASKLFIANAEFYDFSLPIDDFIPFCPPFVVFYILAYLQWFVSYIVIAHEGREYCHKVMTSDIVAKIICFVFFIALPTTMVRAEVGNGIFDKLVSFIYSLDSPVNLFPSVHCLESWVAFRCALPLKKVPSWYKWTMGFVSFGVFASVVLVKQHVFIDIPAGILVFEIGMILTKLFGLDRFFALKGNSVEK